MSKHRRRRSSDARHVRLYHHVLNSQAWLALSAPARVVYIEIFRLYNGANNGQLALSVRTAAERCRIAKDTAARAFKELEDDVTGRLPDKNFMRWGRDKQKPVPNDALTVPKQAQKAA